MNNIIRLKAREFVNPRHIISVTITWHSVDKDGNLFNIFSQANVGEAQSNKAIPRASVFVKDRGNIYLMGQDVYNLCDWLHPHYPDTPAGWEVARELEEFQFSDDDELPF